MSKHTPGPWKVWDRGRYPGIEGKDRSVVVFGYEGEQCGVRGEDHEERQANARLISASLDLADVAHMVLNTATVYTPPELVQAATEALRKAGEIGGEVGE